MSLHLVLPVHIAWVVPVNAHVLHRNIHHVNAPVVTTVCQHVTAAAGAAAEAVAVAVAIAIAVAAVGIGSPAAVAVAAAAAEVVVPHDIVCMDHEAAVNCYVKQACLCNFQHQLTAQWCIDMQQTAT